MVQPRRALHGALAALSVAPPHPAQPPSDLGLLVYPGAPFEPQTSALLSGGQRKFWVYLSDDPVGTVLRFYEQRAAKRAQQRGEGMYVIAVRGELPWPEIGVTVQPNTIYGGSAKSVITITHRVVGPEPTEGLLPGDTAAREAQPDPEV